MCASRRGAEGLVLVLVPWLVLLNQRNRGCYFQKKKARTGTLEQSRQGAETSIRTHEQKVVTLLQEKTELEKNIAGVSAKYTALEERHTRNSEHMTKLRQKLKSSSQALDKLHENYNLEKTKVRENPRRHRTDSLTSSGQWPIC